VCSFDFTFRKCICESIALRASKFRVVDDYFYGDNEPVMSPKQRQIKGKIKRYEELILYRGHHICDSKTFIDFLPKLFCSTNETECNKLLNIEFWKIKKLRHPERQLRFLVKFQEQVKKLAYKDWNQKQKMKKNNKLKNDESDKKESSSKKDQINSKISKKSSKRKSNKVNDKLSFGEKRLSVAGVINKDK
jgi:hypothetical protein